VADGIELSEHIDIRLDRLHLLIQAAMGWTNSHLYEIRAGDVGWGIPDPGWPDGPLDARKARLAHRCQLLPHGRARQRADHEQKHDPCIGQARR
jgi:acyl-coenzyme A synthetase/AMP-(fatty) acid ligase